MELWTVCYLYANSWLAVAKVRQLGSEVVVTLYQLQVELFSGSACLERQEKLVSYDARGVSTCSGSGQEYVVMLNDGCLED